MFISHQYRVIFVHIQRTGGNSIHRVFEEYDPTFQYKLPLDPALKRLKHPFARDIKAVLENEIFEQYTKFCVVRNPFDRMVSWYSMFTHGTIEQNIPSEYSELKTLGDAVELAVTTQAPTFEDFINLPATGADGLFARFHVPQLAYLTAENGQVLVDRILRFENLAADFAALAKDIGFAGQLPHANRSIREASYRAYYSEAMKDEMLRRFKEDFEYFGYTF